MPVSGCLLHSPGKHRAAAPASCSHWCHQSAAGSAGSCACVRNTCTTTDENAVLDLDPREVQSGIDPWNKRQKSSWASAPSTVLWFFCLLIFYSQSGTGSLIWTSFGLREHEYQEPFTVQLSPPHPQALNELDGWTPTWTDHRKGGVFFFKFREAVRAAGLSAARQLWV